MIDDESILTQQDMATLAEWWCTLNKWGWPAELPNPEPRPEPLSTYHENSRRDQIMRWIEEAIGMREISRTWNKDRMSPEQFNDFWRGCHEGHAPSRARYFHWLAERSRLESAP